MCPTPHPPDAFPQDTAPADASLAIDNRFLESLIGYNARRAAIAVIGRLLGRMAPFGLRVVDFSVLTLIAHNPGITSRQLSATLAILPPNLVGMVRQLEARGLIEKLRQVKDKRAQGLFTTPEGARLQAEAQRVVAAVETETITRLSEDERQTLIRLLRKVYQGDT